MTTSPPSMWRLTALALSLAACQEPSEDSGADTGVTPDLEPCEQPLAITGVPSAVGPYAFVQLGAEGGTGAYRWALSEGGSGGSLSGSGAYLSGPGVRTIDAIEISDRGCTGTASAEISVVGDLLLLPALARVTPGTTMTFDVRDGSGSTACSLASTTTGAQVTNACVYTAGSSDGQDVVRVTDSVTGTYVDAVVDVSADFHLVIEGQGLFAMPSGSRASLVAATGSGWLDVEVTSGTLQLDGSTLVGDTPGRSRVRATDHYTGESVDLPVEVLFGHVPSLLRDGERTGAGVLIPLGDIDGDGYGDVAFGHPELSFGGSGSGGVAIYAGGPSGLDITPVQVIEGTAANEDWGRSLWVGDLDDDGRVDLVIGADRTDRGGTNTGSVRAYATDEYGFFESEPWLQVHGDLSYVRLGSSVTACDFDGDGWLDLAVGARDGSDQTVAVPADDQGSVYVFKGGESGFGAQADFILHGQLPDGEGGWRHVEGMHFGLALAAGDLDGDGLCDLAVGSPEGGPAGADEDGIVQIFGGTVDQGLVLERTPRAAVAGDDAELGRALAIGDVDGDGLADLLIGAWRDDTEASNAGAAALFWGGSWATGLADPTEPLTLFDADWWVRGTEKSHYLGNAVFLQDATGDGLADVGIGLYRGKAPAGGYSSGAVRIYDGAEVSQTASAASYDATDDEPWFEAGGVASYDRMGQAATAADVNGDGAADVVALAGHDDTWGIDLGAVYWSPTSAPLWSLLEMPGSASGSLVGQAITLFDTDGDGCEDIVIGAPDAGTEVEGANAGQVVSAQCDDGGITQLFGGHPTHSYSDRFGYVTRDVGDFDGDGYADLAVVARKESRPSSWDDAFVGGEDCEGYRFQAGAVYVYRGGPSGMGELPDFAIFGPESSGYIYSLAGGFDHNGDGYSDLALGSFGWGDNTGGFGLVHGRPAAPGSISVICDAEYTYGFDTYDRLGDTLAGAGDIDGDGCDELAVGASREELAPDWYNQGTVRVLWGYGGPTCATEPSVTTLAFRTVGRELGSGLAAGGDVDGDGVPDLFAGADASRVDFSEVGGAWLIPGSYVLQAPRQAMTDGLPAEADTQWVYPLPESGLDVVLGLPGWESGSLYGTEIALVPDPLVPGRSMVAIGSPLGSLGGTPWTGGVRVHRWSEDGLDPVPWAVVTGESSGPFGLLGQVLHGGEQGGVPALVIGAPLSSAAGVQQGAAYLLRFEEVEE